MQLVKQNSEEKSITVKTKGMLKWVMIILVLINSVQMVAQRVDIITEISESYYGYSERNSPTPSLDTLCVLNFEFGTCFERDVYLDSSRTRLLLTVRFIEDTTVITQYYHSMQPKIIEKYLRVDGYGCDATQQISVSEFCENGVEVLSMCSMEKFNIHYLKVLNCEGTVISEMNYNSYLDRKEGSYILRHTNGIIKEIGNYKDGKKDGVFYYCNAKGKITRKLIYSSNSVDRKRNYRLFKRTLKPGQIPEVKPLDRK